MSFINTLDFVGEDTRKRKFLLPKAVVKTSGIVNAPENLFIKKPLQIGLSEPCVTELVSTETETASIVLDYGCEMQGGIRLLVANFPNDVPYPEVRITFGESLSEV